MGHKISKSFTFAYGHRVWSQVLDGEFSDNLQCACRHLHGHEGRVELTLTPHVSQHATVEPSLVRGMVTDFRHTEFLKKFIDSTIDHKFILDRSDPLCSQLLAPQGLGYPKGDLSPAYLSRSVGGLTQAMVAGWVVNPSAIQGELLCGEANSHKREYLESFFIVDFVPTSENLSKWLFGLVEWKMERLCAVESVDWWETAKSHALYSRG